MNRAEALASVASAALGAGSLLYYEPGVKLVIDHPICDARAFRPKAAPEHVFDAVRLLHENDGSVAWGYYVDPNV
jgi:hypothetical protein